MIDTATPEDIGRLYGLEWTPALLLRLANRVDEAAHESPREGYELAMRALVHLGQRYGDEDVEARGWMCAGIAARRLGRAGEASDLYARAKRLAKHPSILGRLYVSIAVLARDQEHFADALAATSLAERLGDTGPNHDALVLITRGSIHLERARSRNARWRHRKVADLAEAESLYVDALGCAAPGSTEQICALVNLVAVLGAVPALPARMADIRRLLGGLRRHASGSRSRFLCRAVAVADWIEGRLFFRLGSARQGERFLLRAARKLARLGFLRDALEASADLAELATEQGLACDGLAEVAALVPRESRYKPTAEALARLAAGMEDRSLGAAGVRESLSAAG